MVNGNLNAKIEQATELQPQNMNPMMIKMIQGENPMGLIFPQVGSADTFSWMVESDTTKFNLIKEVGESGSAYKNAIKYAQQLGSTKDFFESVTYTEKILRASLNANESNLHPFMDLVADAMELLKTKFLLKNVYDGITALTNTTLYPTINTETKESAWTTPASSKVVTDIIKADTKIREDEKTMADYVIMSLTEYKNMLLSNEVKGTNLYTQEVVNNVYIETIAKKKIIVLDAMYANSAGAMTPLLNGTVILVKSGLVGENRVSKQLEMSRNYVIDNRELNIYAEYSNAYIIKKPQLICLLSVN